MNQTSYLDKNEEALTYTENLIIRDNLYEYVHCVVCDLFWQTPSCSNGDPIGYSVYKIDSESLTLYNKVIEYNKNFQFRVYLAGFNSKKPTVVTVNVWKFDPEGKVCRYKNGVPKRHMTQYNGHDPEVVSYILYNKDNMRTPLLGNMPTSHLFFVESSSPEPEISIEDADRCDNKYIQKVKRLIMTQNIIQ